MIIQYVKNAQIANDKKRDLNKFLGKQKFRYDTLRHFTLRIKRSRLLISFLSKFAFNILQERYIRTLKLFTISKRILPKDTTIS